MEVFGGDLAALYANAARALFDILVQGPRAGTGLRHDLRFQGADAADLMVNWLRELLFLWNAEQQFVKKVTIREVSQTTLHAMVETIAYDPDHHDMLREIKAVTYHRIAVEEQMTKWRATIFFDV
jgi:SHS2 domain-containing protein